jgi:hypothetical protein
MAQHLKLHKVTFSPSDLDAKRKNGVRIPGKDFTPWIYALYRVNKRVLTRKIGQSRVTLRDFTL